jgi:FkbM family methyltransferase
VQLAWGLPIEVDPEAWVGKDIVNIGLHDRLVPEAIWRLLDPGELAFDVGANVGQNASMMALKLGPGGRVVAFEPGPEALRLLTRNVAGWQRYRLSPISVVPKGVSSRNGAGVLYEAPELGGFSLEDCPAHPLELLPNGARFDVHLITLDSYAMEDQIGLIKIDVEGHEGAVLEGAGRILERQLVRDIIFEDFQQQPSPVTISLQAAGYQVFFLSKVWRKPLLIPLEQYLKSPERSDLNFLATRDPERARERFKGAGWKCLSARARLKE